MELWMPVFGLEHSHQVSSLGNLRTIARDVVYFNTRLGREVTRTLVQKPVKTRLDSDGYVIANLSTEKAKTLTVKVHRLVAQAFIDNPEDKPHVNHSNGIKTDNRVENLEWVTNYENRIHALNNGLHATGERSPHAKLSNATVEYVKRRLTEGDRNVDIANDLGISHKLVSSIKCGSSWSRVRT